MNIDELEKKYAELGREIERLKAKPNKKRERVAEGEKYWILETNGRPNCGIEHNVSIDSERFAIGNYYYSLEEAIKARNRRLAEQRIFDALREHEGDWEADWDTNHDNCIIHYDHEINVFNAKPLTYTHSLTYVQWVSDRRYYSTKEACQWVIRNMQDDLRIVWGLEREE